jgi:hypothetical protein
MELTYNKDVDFALDKTTTKVYLEFNDIAETKIKINIQRIKSWPKSQSTKS